MASLSSLSRLSAILTLDTTNFIRNSERVSAKLLQLRQQAVGFGQGFSRSVTFGFALVGAAAIKVAADFDRVDAQLQAVTGGKGLERLREQSSKLGRETIFTRTEVAGLQLELSKLGFAAAETAASVEATTKITTVFGGDLTKVGTTIAEVIRQFSNSNLDAGRVADVLAVAFRNTALSTENFSQAMKNVGSVANITGNDFETTVALLGLLANAGQKGGIAGTRLKGVMIRLGKQFGVTGDEIKLLTSGQLDFNQLIEIFRNRAGVAAASIGELGEEFELLKAQLLDAEGAADAMAAGLEERLFFSLERIKNSLQSVGIVIGEALTPFMLDLADIFQNIAQAVKDMDRDTLKLILTLAGLFATVGPLVFILSQLAGVIGGIIIAPTVAIIVTLVTALTAALVAMNLAYSSSFGTVKRANQQFEDQIKATDTLARDSLPLLTKAQKDVQEQIDELRGGAIFQLFGEEGLSSTDKAALKALEDSFVEIDDKIKAAENTIAKDLPKALETFRAESQRIGGEIAEALVQREEIQQQIRRSFQDYGRETFFIGRGRGGLTAQETFERLGQDELSVSLRINNLEAEAERAVDEFVKQFSGGDLSLFSTAELQQAEESFKAISESFRNGLAGLQEQRDSPFSRVFAQFPRILEETNDKIGTGVGLINSIFGLSLRIVRVVIEVAKVLFDVSGILEQIEKTEIDLAANEKLRLQFAEELKRRQEEQLRLAEEAQKLSEEFSGTFGDAADAKDAIDRFNKLLESLRGVAGQFGATTGRVLDTQATIGLLNEKTQNLSDILKRGFFTKNILSNVLGGYKDIEEQETAINGVVSALEDYIAELIAAGDFSLATVFESALANYKDLQQQISRRVEIQALRDAAAEALGLADALKGLGNLEQIDFLNRQLGILQTKLEGALKLGLTSTAASTQKEIARIKELLEALKETIEATKFDFQLGFLDPKIVTDVDKLNESLRQLDVKRQDVLEGLSRDFNTLAGTTPELAIATDSLTDTTLLANLDKLQNFIANAGDDVDTQPYKDLEQAIFIAIKRLREFKTESETIEEDLRLKAIGKQAEELEKSTAQFEKLQGFGLFTDAEAATQRLQSLRRELDFAILNQQDLNDPDGLRDLIGSYNGALEVVNGFTRQQQAIQFFQQQLSFIGDAFVEAAQGGEDFFEAFKQGFINTFNALVGKLITLIALFAILAAFGVVKFDGKAFGSFLSAGFGFDSLAGGVSLPGTKSLEQGGLAVEGSISGNNIVLANQRGTRAIDRTFG